MDRVCRHRQGGLRGSLEHGQGGCSMEKDARARRRGANRLHSRWLFFNGPFLVSEHGCFRRGLLCSHSPETGAKRPALLTLGRNKNPVAGLIRSRFFGLAENAAAFCDFSPIRPGTVPTAGQTGGHCGAQGAASSTRASLTRGTMHGTGNGLARPRKPACTIMRARP